MLKILEQIIMPQEVHQLITNMADEHMQTMVDRDLICIRQIQTAEMSLLHPDSSAVCHLVIHPPGTVVIPQMFPMGTSALCR